MVYQGRTSLSQRVPHVGSFSVTATGRRDDFSSSRRVDRREFVGDLQVEYSRDLLFTPAAEIQLQQAELGLSISRSNLNRRELQLEEQVTNSFYDLVQAIRELEIQQQRLEQSTAALDLALRKFEIGLIAEVEALRLRVEKLRAEAEFTRARTQIESQRDRLREILGMEMDEPLEVLTAVDHQVVPISEGQAVEIGLRRRSDLREAEWSRRSSELSLRDLEQQLGPTAQLTTRMTLLGRGPDASDVSSTFERSFVSAGVRMELPLVDGGERRSRVRRAEIDLEKSLLNRKSVERGIVREIRDAVRSVAEAEQQIELGRRRARGRRTHLRRGAQPVRVGAGRQPGTAAGSDRPHPGASRRAARGDKLPACSRRSAGRHHGRSRGVERPQRVGPQLSSFESIRGWLNSSSSPKIMRRGLRRV